jgi:hypothetical protein
MALLSAFILSGRASVNVMMPCGYLGFHMLGHDRSCQG